MTKEERLLLQLSRLSKGLEGGEGIELTLLASAMGVTAHSLRNMCNGLAQANFIRRSKEGKVSLTPHGEALVERLQQGG